MVELENDYAVVYADKFTFFKEINKADFISC